MPHSRNPIDIHVGSQVRLRRIQLGVSKEALASEFGLTSIEMHNRENGSIRLSAKMLFDIGKILRVEPTYFFEGFFTGGLLAASTELTIAMITKPDHSLKKLKLP